MRTKNLVSNIEEDIDRENQFRNKNPPNPLSIRAAAPEIQVDNIFYNPSRIENDKDVDLNDKNLEKNQICSSKLSARCR